MTDLTGVSLVSGAGPRGEKNLVKLGRYEVVRELGKGAMGIVYLAKDPLIGRLVALKTIRPAAHADDDETKEFQQRFVREAQAAGILNHPAIVTVHDIGQDDSSGVSFIAMEYVEGQNLKEILAQGRPMTFDQIGDIISQVADGLDFAHAKGIVHRDVKPANIILIEGMRAKITDFGIAKIATSAANLTSTGQFLGTPNYMAPEQIKGAPVDGRTDIFSLGICLYECLTRRKPFGGDSLTSISYKIVHEPFPPILEINPLIPEGYEDVVAHCLEKDPAKRFQRGRDVGNALRAVIRGEKPVRPSDPMLAEATMVTRIGDHHHHAERERQPTVEIPFPEADDSSKPAVGPLDTNPTPPVAASAAVKPQPAARKSAPKQPPAVMLRKTLDGVRAYPAWRRHVQPAIFFAIIGVLVAALLGGAWAIEARKSKPPDPKQVDLDRRTERQHAMERQLRLEGEKLLHEGRVDDAYAKFEQLSRIAPASPANTMMLQRLSLLRQQRQATQQQVVQAKQKFEEGMAFYNKKQYADAIKSFNDANSLNMTEETLQYLKLAQEADALQQQQKQARAQMQQQPSRVTQVPSRTTTVVPATQPVVSTAPAQITTAFNNKDLADGYITVKIGNDVVVREPLFEEKTRFLMKRKQPRAVNVTKEMTPKNADVFIYIDVPAQQIKESHTIPRQNFQPGTSHRLVVSYDAASKKFDYTLN